MYYVCMCRNNVGQVYSHVQEGGDSGCLERPNLSRRHLLPGEESAPPRPSSSLHTYTYLCFHVCIYVCMYVHMYVCMYFVYDLTYASKCMYVQLTREHTYI